MNALERYLARATRGLWGRRKREARQELESHVFERVRQLTLLGLDGTEAERAVLRELGEAQSVNAGLLRVHTLPALAPALALALLVGGAGLMATRAAAQVRVPVTAYSDEAAPNPSAVYIGVQALRAAFARAGVEMSGPDSAPTLGAKGLPIITLRLGQNGPGTYEPLRTGDLYRGFNFMTQQYQPYLNVVALAQLAAWQGWPVKIGGWEKPELTIGPATLAMNGPQAAALLYLSEARDRVFAGVCASKVFPLKSASVVSSGFGGISGYQSRTLARTPARPGGVYALAMPYKSEAPEAQKFNNYFVAVAQAGPQGRLTFRLPAAARHLRFVTALKETAPDFQKFREGQSTYEDPAVRGAAILFPLDGTINGDSVCKNALTPLKFTGTSDSP